VKFGPHLRALCPLQHHLYFLQHFAICAFRRKQGLVVETWWKAKAKYYILTQNKKNKMKGERGKKIDSEKLVEAKHVETDELEVEDLIIA